MATLIESDDGLNEGRVAREGENSRMTAMFLRGETGDAFDL